MTRIAMDPSQVKAMAALAERTAGSISDHMGQILSTARSAEWTSQAREDFIERLEALSRVNGKSASSLRLMSRAAIQKADQWESKANRFNSLLERIGSSWSSFLDELNNTWQSLVDSISRVAIGGFAVISGGIASIGGFIDGITFPWEHSTNPSEPTLQPEKPKTEPDAEQQKPPVVQPEPVPETPAPRSYPYPPNKIQLTDTNDIRSCAYYAQGRRKDLGAAGKSGPYPEGAAANYRFKFADKAFQISDGEKGNLKEAVGVGYAITWEPYSKGYPNAYGHVAIIEEVHDNYIVISEATTYPTDHYHYNTRRISFDELNREAIWLIP